MRLGDNMGDMFTHPVTDIHLHGARGGVNVKSLRALTRHPGRNELNTHCLGC